MATPLRVEKNAPAPRHWIADWVVNILVLLFGTATVMQAFVVPTGSMEGTMLIGDHLFVDRLAYSPPGPVGKFLLPYQEVKRGDIIVFRFPLDIRENYVKRVIGVPGDRIRLVDKTLYLNGHRVEEPYKVLIPGHRSSYLENFPQTPDILIPERGLDMLRRHVINGELVVPPGHYFAMGDNRDNSSDGRYWGLVPSENIIGKPALVWWSYDAPTPSTLRITTSTSTTCRIWPCICSPRPVGPARSCSSAATPSSSRFPEFAR